MCVSNIWPPPRPFNKVSTGTDTKSVWCIIRCDSITSVENIAVQKTINSNKKEKPTSKLNFDKVYFVAN